VKKQPFLDVIALAVNVIINLEESEETTFLDVIALAVNVIDFRKKWSYRF
jgi:hypothetical protein